MDNSKDGSGKDEDNLKELQTRKDDNEDHENDEGELISEATGGKEPPDPFNLTNEEREITVMYENIVDKQKQQQPLEQKKPPRNILEKLLEKNAKGLEQSPSLLGPGTMFYVKWVPQLKKSNKAPWDTAWGLIKLTAETHQPHDSKAAWHWVHPTRAEVRGHIKLVKNQS